MPKSKAAKVKPDPATSSGGTLIAVFVVLAAVCAFFVAGEALSLRRKPPGIAELRMTLTHASLAADRDDYMTAHRLAESMRPYHKVRQPPSKPGSFWLNLTKLEKHRVPAEGLDVFLVKNVVTPEEAEMLRSVLSTAYDHWKIEEDICFDHVFDIEKEVTKPTWWWRDRLLADNVLSADDLFAKDTGRYKAWCLRRAARTPEKLRRVRSFLKVSRSVIAHRGLSNITDQIEARISDITGAPVSRAYYTQFLHYTAGERYNTHTDCTLNQMGMPLDERYMTTLLYLSTTEGGETAFPVVNVSFTPTLGDLVVWRNVYESTGVCNTHSYHAALPVKAGEKFVYQKWWKFDPQDHNSDPFTTPLNNLGCDRNGACREYIYVHRLPKEARDRIP
ncbi:putative prolyl 4-hydroxylase 3 [Diplonema papillatum]|nr:putative prolyl 4-hydroxylase 3 [Diplonema papillatum]